VVISLEKMNWLSKRAPSIMHRILKKITYSEGVDPNGTLHPPKILPSVV